MEIADELAAQYPHVIDVLLDRLWRQTRRCQVFQEWTEQRHELLAVRQIFLQPHPGAWPAVQIPAIVFEFMASCGGRAVYVGSFRHRHLPPHAAAHYNSKPMPPFSGIRLSASPLQLRSEEH